MTAAVKTSNKRETDIASLRKGYDIRIVPYEEIHSIRPQDFETLVRVINPQPGDYILDAGAGYGAVTREVVLRSKTDDLRFCVLDISPVQLKRGIRNLERKLGGVFVHEHVRFVQDSLLHPACEDSSFDKAAAKMVIHEIPRYLQPQALKEIFRVLKPNGKLVVWDLMLDGLTQKFFQDVIRKKDELAGFQYLAKYRYFLREDEWVELLTVAGFTEIKKEADVFYELHTNKRLGAELGGDEQKLLEWHEFIRERVKELPAEVQEKLRFKDRGNDITFIPPKAIYSALRK